MPVRRYLESRRLQQGKEREAEPPHKNLAQLLMESPFAGAELDLERRQDYALQTVRSATGAIDREQWVAL